MSDNDSGRVIAQQSPKAKERLRELRRKTEKITNLYLGVRVKVVHKTSPFSFFFYQSVRFFESILDLCSDFCTALASELPLLSPTSAPSVGSSSGAVLLAPVGWVDISRFVHTPKMNDRSGT